MGSYEFIPIGRVLLSERGILLKVPIAVPKDGKTADVVVLSTNIVCIKAYFSLRSTSKSVIFIRASPPHCRSTSQALGLKNNAGPFWDGAPGTDETRKWLKLSPDYLDRAGIAAVKQAFASPQLYYGELNAVEAKDLEDDIRVGPSRVK